LNVSPALPSEEPPPRNEAARLPKKTGQMIRLPATAKSSGVSIRRMVCTPITISNAKYSPRNTQSMIAIRASSF